jgi:hypothetical protein
MTVVLEDQVKTIAAAISEQFGDGRNPSLLVHFDEDAEIEDVVRAVIAQYDISSIARLEVDNHEPSRDG